MKNLSQKIDKIAKQKGFAIKRTCENNAFYYLMDETREGWNKYNAKGESLCVEIGMGQNYVPNSKHSLPYLWYKNGHTEKILQNWWEVQTYITKEDGMCYRAYDPTIKPSDDGKRFVINFDWMLDATEENFEKILDEILKRFFEI